MFFTCSSRSYEIYDFNAKYLVLMRRALSRGGEGIICWNTKLKVVAVKIQARHGKEKGLGTQLADT